MVYQEVIVWPMLGWWSARQIVRPVVPFLFLNIYYGF